MVFYGLRLGMSCQEIDVTRYGMMVDLIACNAVYHGAARQKKKLDYQTAISLR